MTVEKEDILKWLITFGREWVGIDEVHEAYRISTDSYQPTFWHMLKAMHDAAYITKRHKAIKVDYYVKAPSKHSKEWTRKYKDLGFEQYRLTQRAIDSLNE